MSDTPRTDAAIKASDGQWSFALRDLAQEMERELAVRIYSDDGPNDWKRRDLDQIDNEEHERWIESQKPLD